MENRMWHWIFWILYYLLNHMVFSHDIFTWESLLITFIFTAHNASVAYATLDWWIPKFYQQKRYFAFAIAVGGTILFFSLSLIACLWVVFSFITTFTFEAFIDEFAAPGFFSNFSGLAMIIIPYFIFQRIEMERRNRQLEKEKLAAELKFLKSQLHPHFLFNALNNIYFLIKKDPNTAAEALAGFSNLLRFQLYDANKAQIPLQQEIEYLQQFAEIAQLRKGKGFEVNWQLPSKVENIEIAPLLLMPLLENAFKHSSNKNGYIDIVFKVEQDKLQLKIANSKEMHKSIGLNGFEEGGIGLKNIQKRLELLYPNQHTFSISDREKFFSIELELMFTKLGTKNTTLGVICL